MSGLSCVSAVHSCRVNNHELSPLPSDAICEAKEGANGTVLITVITRQGLELVRYESSGACIGCAASLACDVFPSAYRLAEEVGIACGKKPLISPPGGRYYASTAEAPLFAVQYYERRGEPFAERILCRMTPQQCREAEKTLFTTTPIETRPVSR